jgi:signal transduction histidine kinase
MGIVKEVPTDAFSLEQLLRAEPTKEPASPHAGRQLRLLLKVSEALSDPAAVETLPDHIVRLVPQIVPVERAVLVIARADGDFEVAASHTTVPAPTGMFSRQIARYVLDKRVAVLSLDALTDNRFDATGSSSIIAQSIRASMCAPLRGRQRLLGVLYADNVTTGDSFSEDDLRLLVGFANQAAIALENSELTRQLAEAAKARERELMVLVDERTRELQHALEQAREATREADRQRSLAEEANHLAQEASKAKSRFLASMSHELRTPLGGIIGYTEILHEECQEEGREDYVADLEKVLSAAKHLLALINDILDLSKIEAGKMDLLLHDFDLGVAIHEVVTTVKPLAERRGNKLVVQGTDDVGQVFADETRLRQVLFNLLSNASKFTEGGTITLKVERAPRNGTDWLSLRVTDTGIGMTPEQLSRLFRAFSQAEANTSHKYGGTGLGLAISREFCRMMGGEVTASSAHGEGSVFSIEIPARVESRPPTQ